MTTNSITDAVALEPIAAILGLYTTELSSDLVAGVLADITGYIQQTGSPTNAPEGA